MKNKNHIGIVFGGYVDENNKLMDRMELNRRIASLQKQVSELTEALNAISSNIKNRLMVHGSITGGYFEKENS